MAELVSVAELVEASLPPTGSGSHLGQHKKKGASIYQAPSFVTTHLKISAKTLFVFVNLNQILKIILVKIILYLIVKIIDKNS